MEVWEVGVAVKLRESFMVEVGRHDRATWRFHGSFVKCGRHGGGSWSCDGGVTGDRSGARNCCWAVLVWQSHGWGRLVVLEAGCVDGNC